MSLFSKIITSLLVLTILGCSGGSGGGSGTTSSGDASRPPTRPAAAISGVAFDGLIINGNVSVMEFQTTGPVLAQAQTNSQGEYGIDLSSTDIPVLITIDGGRYIEEASRKNIVLQSGQVLVAANNYLSGQTLEMSVTFWTTVATGLAEYIVNSTGAAPMDAIKEANQRISDYIGIDIEAVEPLDVTDTRNSAPLLSPGLIYGFLAAANSQLTQDISIANGEDAHEARNSIAFAQLAYDDIRHDGQLNGIGSSGAIFMGIVPITADTYKSDIPTKMVEFAGSPNNLTQLDIDLVTNYARDLAARANDLFDGTPGNIDNISPVISQISIAENDSIRATVALSAQVNDLAGVDTFRVVIDDTTEILNVEDIANQMLFEVNFETFNFSNGPHKISFIATNDIGNSSQTDVNITIDNLAPTVVSFTPLENEIVSGTVSLIASVQDDLEIVDAFFELDGAFFSGVITLRNPAILQQNFDSTDYTDGTHVMTIVVTNQAGLTTRFSRTFIIDNLPPQVTSAIPTYDPSGEGACVTDLVINDASPVTWRSGDQNSTNPETGTIPTATTFLTTARLRSAGIPVVGDPTLTTDLFVNTVFTLRDTQNKQTVISIPYIVQVGSGQPVCNFNPAPTITPIN